MAADQPIQAVAFDLGGVVLGSPLAGIEDYERANNVPLGYVNVCIVTEGNQGAFQRLERGEMSMSDFYPKWKSELENPAKLDVFAEFKKISRSSLPNRVEIDTVELFRVMLERSMWADADFVHAIYMLRASGLKVGALTNNFAPMGSTAPGALNLHALEDLFDYVVESAVAGVRKPDPKAFLLLCEKLDVDPKRTIFLDDIGLNLKGAKSVGMETIHVKLKDKVGALRQIEEIILRRNKTPISIVFDEAKKGPRRVFWDISSDPLKKKVLVGDCYGFACDPPILLLHGGGQSRHAWGNTCLALAAKGFFAVAIDMKGHGESYWDEDGDYSSLSYALDIDPLLTKMGMYNRCPLIVGASLGGLASLESKICLANDKCAGLVLVDVTPRLELSGVQRVLGFMQDGMVNGFDTLEDVAKAIQAYQPHRSRDQAASLEGLKKNLIFDETRKKYVFHWDPKFLMNRNLTEVSNLIEYENRLLESARKITIPVLLIRGKLTDIVSEKGIDSLKSAIPDAQVVDVQDAGHMIAGDKNDVFSHELIKFALSRKDRMQKSSLSYLPRGSGPQPRL